MGEADLGGQAGIVTAERASEPRQTGFDRDRAVSRAGLDYPRAGRAELRCAACGYGLVIRRPAPACPMCQASEWEQVAWRPFAPPDL
jgi:hypothetical protein